MELTLPQARPRYNPTNGRFLKGHVPANKGKKWDEYMSEEGKRNASKGWANLEKGHAYGHPDTNGGRRRKPVVAIHDDGTVHYFGYIGAAARHYGGNRENVGRCCRDNARLSYSKHDWSRGRKKGSGHINTDHRYMGIRFYFESDLNIWKSKVKC